MFDYTGKVVAITGASSGLGKASAEALAQNGCDVIATEHHLLLPNVSPLINKGQSSGGREAVAARLADAGLRLMLAGQQKDEKAVRELLEKLRK